MWQLTDDYSWEHLRRRFYWIRALQGVPQDPTYHAEGDVETHTRLVLEALQALPEFGALPQQDQHLLRAAALLHDVEKPSTTRREADGSISARGHAKKGELSSRSILYLDIPTPSRCGNKFAGWCATTACPSGCLIAPTRARPLLKPAWR
ncbi:HD domain-containing protein [Cesiribacter andamanensis]|uniref:Putative domain HDIG n=1 Tax=Cesiribacter andamanensis AMV16 TaxID=1279009 RepID=M7N272_9BACT|nr:HD domain-containing protein [Cesiribacter andamanensis]EMR01412.1 putative domain HDIG [Cesiribacter andamanensis AMV16]